MMTSLSGSEFGKTKSQAWLWLALAIGLFLVIALLALQSIQVPYIVPEIYSEQEPYAMVQEYTAQEPYTVSVPYVEHVTEPVSEEVPVLRGFGDVQPYTYKDRTCWLTDYEYSVQYFDGSHDDLVLLADLGFDKGTSTDPVRTYLSSFDRYSSGTKVGYDETSHILTVAALICNKEKRRINGKFAVCEYAGGRKVNCPDSITPRVASNKCQVAYLRWWTHAPEGKTMRIEPMAISQKFVCEPIGRASGYEPDGPLMIDESTLRSGYGIGLADYETVYLKIDTMYYTPYYAKMFGYYAEQEGYHKPIITASGTLALPAKYDLGIRDIRVNDAVESSTREFLRRSAVTMLRNETRYRNVTKTEVVTEYRTVDKKREVTKTRSLLDELLLRLGVV
jgi:hypothetical protein